MSREQILSDLQQEYMQRREENLRLFEQRQQEACQRCPGLAGLLSARHGAVMQGVRTSLLARDKSNSANAGLAEKMGEMNRQIAEVLTRGGFPADYLQPVYTCPLCRDEGYVYDPSRRMCQCMQQELTRRLMAENGLDDSRSFEAFDESLYSDQPDETGNVPRTVARNNRIIAQRYAEHFPDTRVKNLLVMGKSGLGKTFLLQCIAQRVAQRGYSPLYVSAYRLFEVARQAYMENKSELLSDYMKAPLLLLDDLGTEPMMNNITIPQLFNLINERENTGLHTIISTNLVDGELQERYTERVASRLKDKTNWACLYCIGDDVRTKRK